MRRETTTNDDGSVVQVPVKLVGQTFNDNNYKTSCSDAFVITIGFEVDAAKTLRYYGQTNAVTCDRAVAFAQLHLKLQSSSIGGDVKLIDDNGRDISQLEMAGAFATDAASDKRPQAPFAIIALSSKVSGIQFETNSTNNGAFGFGNAEAAPNVVPTYSDWASFGEQAALALGISPDVLAITYERNTGSIAMNLQLGWNPTLVSQTFSAKASLEPIGSLKASGDVTVTASVDTKLKLIFDLKAPAQAIVAYCRSFDDGSWNQAPNVLPDKFHFTVSMYDDGSDPLSDGVVQEYVTTFEIGNNWWCCGDINGKRWWAERIGSILAENVEQDPKWKNLIKVTFDIPAPGNEHAGLGSVIFSTLPGNRIRSLVVTSDYSEFSCETSQPASSYRLLIEGAHVGGSTHTFLSWRADVLCHNNCA
jgi:hypothetical protein